MNKFFYITDNSGTIRTRSQLWMGSINLLAYDVKDMVTQVLNNLGPDDRIQHLLITGYGRPGFQSVGSGIHNDNSGGRIIQLGGNGHILAPADQYLSQLNRKFITGGYLTLGGEGVGQDPRLLQQLSMLLSGIYVQAGIRNFVSLHPGDQAQVVRCSFNNIFQGTAIW